MLKTQNRRDREPSTTWLGVLKDFLIDKGLEILGTISLVASFIIAKNYPAWTVLAFSITAGFVLSVLVKRYRSY